MKVGEDNFVVLQGWMLAEEYDLTARELIILGLINGFSQDGDSKFQGNLSYIQEWSRSKSRTTAIETLKSLEGKGLIVKESELINGVLFNRYRAIYRGSTKIDPPVQKLDRGSTKIEHNNINNNISTSTNTPPINNLFDNINKSEEENLICQWLKDDLEIRQLQFKRLGLIENLEDFERVLDEQVAKFYEQCRLDGKGDIRNRGRLEVISHFNNWIKAVTKIKEDDAANRKDNSRSEEEFLAMLGCKC
jgi:hypothetical protein